MKDFNIDKFLAVLLDRLVMLFLFIDNFLLFIKLNILLYSASDDMYHHILLSMIKTVPMKAFVSRIVSRLLATQMKFSQGKFNAVLSELGLYFWLVSNF